MLLEVRVDNKMKKVHKRNNKNFLKKGIPTCDPHGLCSLKRRHPPNL